MTADDRSNDNSDPKKVYRTPELRVYGDIKQLTQANPQGMGKMDSAATFPKTG